MTNQHGGPPADIPAGELFLQLCEPKPSEVIDFPRKSPITKKPITRVRVQVLSMREHENARITAHKKLREKYNLKADEMGDMTIREVCGDAIAREVLALACLHEKAINGTEESDTGPKYPKMFRDADHVSDLTAHEIMVLFNAYTLVQEKYGPFENNISSPAEVDRWVKRLVEGGSEFPLLSMTWPRLVELTSSLAARTYSLSHILASQWQSLPDTLRSTLLASCGDIASYGVQLASDDDTGLESSHESFMTGEPITTEDAMDIARRIVGR